MEGFSFSCNVILIKESGRQHPHKLVKEGGQRMVKARKVINSGVGGEGVPAGRKKEF